MNSNSGADSSQSKSKPNRNRSRGGGNRNKSQNVGDSDAVNNDKLQKAMSRDQECRKLNDKKREQTAVLRAKESQLPDNMAEQIAQRVEEEVTQRLMAQFGVQASSATASAGNAKNSKSEKFKKKRDHPAPRPADVVKPNPAPTKPTKNPGSGLLRIVRPSKPESSDSAKSGSAHHKPYLNSSKKNNDPPPQPRPGVDIPRLKPTAPTNSSIYKDGHIEEMPVPRSSSCSSSGNRNRSDGPLPGNSAAERNSLALNKIKQFEMCIQNNIDLFKTDGNALQDYCYLGPSSCSMLVSTDRIGFSSSGLSSVGLYQATMEVSRLYVDYVKNDVVFATSASQKLIHKYWIIRDRQLECFVVCLKLLGTQPPSAKSLALVRQIRNVFMVEVQQCKESIAKLLDTLQNVICEVYDGNSRLTSDNTEHDQPSPVITKDVEDGFCDAIQVLLVALGDLSKYQVMNEEHEHGGDFSQSLKYYRHAAFIDASQGNVYKNIAMLTRAQAPNESDFETVYFLSRSLCVAHPYASNEALLQLFEQGKDKADSFGAVTGLSMLTLPEHCRRYHAHFLACVGIAFSRCGADRFIRHMDKFRRHLSTSLQMIAIDKSILPSSNVQDASHNSTGTGALRDQDSGLLKKPSFSKFSGRSFSGPSLMSADEGRGRVDEENVHMDESEHLRDYYYRRAQQHCQLSHTLSVMDDAIFKSLVICFSLLYYISEKHNFKELVHKCNYKDAANGMPQSFSEESATDSTEKNTERYVEQQLHKIQCIPGVVDLCRLIMNILSTLLGAESIGNSNKSNLGMGGDDHNSLARQMVTIRSVVLFLDWIGCNPEYSLVFTLIFDPSLWELIESSIWTYIISLPKDVTVEADKQISPMGLGELFEDQELRGFVPVADTASQQVLASQRLSQRLRDDTSSLSCYAEYEIACPLFSRARCDSSSVSCGCVDKRSFLARAARCRLTIRSLSKVDVLLGRRPSSDLSDSEAPSPIAFSHKNRHTVEYSAVMETSSKPLKLLKLFSIPDVVVNSIGGGGGVSSQPRTSRSRGGLGHDSHRLLTEEEFKLEAVTAVVGGESCQADVLVGAKAVNDDSSACQDELPMEALELNEDSPDEECVAEEEDMGDVISTGGEAASGAAAGKGGVLRLGSDVATTMSVANTRQQNVHKQRHRQNDNLVSFNARAHHNNSFKAKAGYGTSGGFSGMGLGSAAEPLPLIVIDAANVAMRHGLNNIFSCKGVKLALEFFRRAGHKVVSFLPDYYLNYERAGNLRRQANYKIDGVRAASIPDDVSLLQQLVLEGVVIGTPPQDYDDSYCIAYAKQHDGYLVTNDLYRDHIKRIDTVSLRDESRKWIKSHSISFTFVGDEFIPSPDSHFMSR